jgi:hypothetical protein
MNKGSRKFARKRAISHSKKLFLQLLEYVTFCYSCLKQNKICYSESWCKNNTAFSFEEWLKIRFIEDYLRKFREHFHCSKIETIRFYPETQPNYKDMAGKIRGDKIDIFITNLGLQRYWNGIVEEDIYFAIECKRLKNRSKNAEYLTDIQKFVTREYKFRFPFTGMIGFVEKSSISIDDIIDDINQRLQNSSAITTIQELTPFGLNKFNYCRVSKHEKITSNDPIEVYHLFFDYSNIIIP